MIFIFHNIGKGVGMPYRCIPLQKKHCQ